MIHKLPFLKTDGTDIVDANGRRVVLKGVSLGGWLMMEGYMFGGRNIAERMLKESIEKALGRDALDDFIRSFRDTFVREEDVKTIKGWGANCIRIPFNYRLIEFEDRPFSLNEEGLEYLDRAIGWCQKHGIYCILDMHAAPGSQNPAWHSDSSGAVELFASEVNRDRYFRLWHFLATRYKDVSAVAGYDVLNEPVLPFHQEYILKDLYEKVTGEIRDVDKKHIIFLEGNFWAQKLDFLGKPRDPNTAYSIHTYAPLNFTHNYIPGLRYPGKAYSITWNKEAFSLLARPYRAFAEASGVPLYMGEFGVNARGGYYGEYEWVDDMISIFEKNGMSWTYWTYKTVANYALPDGIFRYTDNPPWVHREGPVSGCETFPGLWAKEKGRMIFSWRTESFEPNGKLLSVLRKHFRGTKKK